MRWILSPSGEAAGEVWQLQWVRHGTRLLHHLFQIVTLVTIYFTASHAWKRLTGWASLRIVLWRDGRRHPWVLRGSISKLHVPMLSYNVSLTMPVSGGKKEQADRWFGEEGYRWQCSRGGKDVSILKGKRRQGSKILTGSLMFWTCGCWCWSVLASWVRDVLGSGRRGRCWPPLWCALGSPYMSCTLKALPQICSPIILYQENRFSLIRCVMWCPSRTPMRFMWRSVAWLSLRKCTYVA